MGAKRGVLNLSLLLIIGIMGCGYGGTQQNLTPDTSQSLDTVPVDTTSTGATGTTGVTGTTGTGVTPYNFRVGTVGYNATSVSVTALKTLIVQFTPGIQDQAVSGTNFEPQYSELGVYITVGSSTQPTAMLQNGYSGGTAQSSTLDFSTSIPMGSCTGLDPTCRTSVTITISQPNYDYWCLNFGEFCPWSHVYSTHPWHGTLLVQTDDTSPLPRP